MSAAKRSLRFVAALAWVVLAVSYIVRSAFVAAYAETDLERAERVWPDHPSVRAARAMLNVAQASAGGHALDEDTKNLIVDVARAEPLYVVPFLIAGAEAQRSSDADRAERLLVQARQRDPRSPAPRFLLAEEYISQGRIRDGVPEAAALGRLVPGSSEPLSKAFASYIQTAGIPEGMAGMLRSDPILSEQILNQLSTDPANAGLLLKIAAMAPRRGPGPAPGWQARLISELVDDGDYAKARLVWAKLGGPEADPSETIHDPRFKGSEASRPFNWTFAAQGAVIEPQSGSLHVLYFGRDDVTLASQLLTLRPGRYRLQVDVSGQVADPQGLRWKMGCLSDKSIILDRPSGTDRVELPFSVPPTGCGAQQLELAARANDAGRSSDFLISNLGLTEEGSR